MHIVDESTSVPPRNPSYEDGGSLSNEQNRTRSTILLRGMMVDVMEHHGFIRNVNS